uniref:Uncharacterized protein n=1 Tax=Theileria annulata TaxID=5874 RepID=A0A3B0NC25_THEAN
MAKIRSRKGNYRATVLVSADIMLSIVCVSTYFIDCELNFISLFFMETLNIPHIHLGIYNSKLTCFRSIFIILGCLTEYGIYKICNRFNLEERHPKYREGLSVFFLFALCVVRIILTLILYFSKQLPLHLYIILNVEAFYFGIFQTSFISLAMDHSGDIKFVNYILSGTMKFFQFRISRSETNKPMFYLKINFFICVGISIISLIIWPVYLFRLHKPLYQYDQYIFFVKTRVNRIISDSEDCIENLNNVKKKMEEIDIPELDVKNEIDDAIGSTTEENDSNNEKDETTIEDEDTEKNKNGGGTGSATGDEDSEKISYSNESEDTESDRDDVIGYANGVHSEYESHSEESEHRESDEEEEENEEENNSTSSEQYSETYNSTNKEENGKSNENYDSDETDSKIEYEDSEKENHSIESENSESEDEGNNENSHNESDSTTSEDEDDIDDVIGSTTEENDSNNEKDETTIEDEDTEKNKNGGGTGSTTGDEDSHNHKESTISESGDEDDDVIISTTDIQDSNKVDISNKSKNNEMDEDNKLIKELFVLLKKTDYSKMYYTAIKIMNENNQMNFNSLKHEEFYQLLVKETNSLLDLGGKIKSFQSTVIRLGKQLPLERQHIKYKLSYLKTEINKALDKLKKLSQTSKILNDQIKKIAHKNLKWALSALLMIIPTIIIFYFLFDGVLPHAIIIDEESKHIIVMTSVALFVGSMPPVVLASKKHEYRYWTWENSCFWLALIPQIAILVCTILAIHSKISYFKFIIDVPIIVTLMCTILGICHGLMESTSFISVTNHVYFHSVDPDDFYLVIIQIILRIYLKYISLKLSACYNEARISLGFFRPDFYTFLEVGSLEAFMITVKETFRRFFFDLFFDIRVNINQFI